MKSKLLFIYMMFMMTPLMHTPVMAQSNVGDTNASNLDKLKNIVGIGTQKNLTDVIVTIVNVVLGLSGLVFTVLIIYGGVVYMTAAGNRDQIDRGKRVITWAIIGLIIVILSLAISRFLGGTLLFSTGERLI